MKYLIVIFVVVAVLVFGVVFFMKYQQPASIPSTNTTSATTSPTVANARNVVISNFNYAPPTLTVKVGDSITWINKDNTAHTATADDNSFDTGTLANGESKSITFSKAGTFTYHCGFHPSMKGTIVVQ